MNIFLYIHAIQRHPLYSIPTKDGLKPDMIWHLINHKLNLCGIIMDYQMLDKQIVIKMNRVEHYVSMDINSLIYFGIYLYGNIIINNLNKFFIESPRWIDNLLSLYDDFQLPHMVLPHMDI